MYASVQTIMAGNPTI